MSPQHILNTHQNQEKLRQPGVPREDQPSLFAQLPNRLIMDIVKLELDRRKEELDEENLQYHIERFGGQERSAGRGCYYEYETYYPTMTSLTYFKEVMWDLMGDYLFITVEGIEYQWNIEDNTVIRVDDFEYVGMWNTDTGTIDFDDEEE
jgi:hypothetical protein